MVPLYLCNVWYSGYFPFNTNFMYDRMGKRINLKLLVDERGNLDLQKFRSYSVCSAFVKVLIQPQPLYATAAYSAKFTFFFAAYTASVVHAGLFHYRQIWSGIKSMFNKEHRRQHQNDIHNRLMQAYDEAPHWWYAIVYVSAFVLAAIGLAKWLPEAPIWVLNVFTLDAETTASRICLGNFSATARPCRDCRGCDRNVYWFKCHLRACGRFCCSGKSYSDEHVQVVRMHVPDERPEFLSRSQIGSLCQSSATEHVSCTTHCNSCICSCGSPFRIIALLTWIVASDHHELADR